MKHLSDFSPPLVRIGRGFVNSLSVALLTWILIGCGHERVKPGENPVILNSVDFHSTVSRTAGIQEAVDALPAEGGVVYIPAGTHRISRAVHLRSGIYVRGEGNHTILGRRYEAFKTKLSQAALTGGNQIEVIDPSGFLVGDEICIRSKESSGWWCTHTLISNLTDSTVVLKDELTHDYLPEEEAFALNLFPTFYAVDAGDIRIEDLCIDGGMREEDRKELPVEFTLSAIHFRAVSDCLIARVHIKNYPADGVSIQMGDNATVSECVSEHNLGHGFHPGTGITSGAWTKNVGRYNGWDGLFFCHRVRHSIISGNRFHNNSWNGIGSLGVGGEGGDRYNVVSGNFCYNNAKSGIECIGGGNNTVANNVCENNSQSEPRRWPGILLEDTFNTIVSGNRCLDFQEPESAKTQAYGILVTGKSQDNLITGNVITGHPLGGISGDAASRSLVENNIVKKPHEPSGM